jgi:hypothetical protein
MSNIEKMVQKAIFDQLKKAHPIMVKTIQREVKIIEQEAKKNWPIRMEKYGPSQGSRNKFKKGLLVSKTTVKGFIENRAPYAYAIKSGRGSDTTVTEGKRIATVLMVDPAKKAAEIAAREIGKKIIQKVKNG